ncbi:MAG: acyl-CoA thioesterase [Rhodospirillaceae bacterium]|nr:acyl-CoA thioesterase [Rhodospirillaceae bacterium]
MRVYRGTFKVEWAHCDAAGIVFYPHYYMLFDQATERLFSANKLSYAELARDFDSPGMPLLETGTKYSAASKLGDTLAVESWVDSWDGKTFVVKHKLTHADGRLALEGFEKRVWVKRDASRPTGFRAVEVPDEVKTRFVD